MKRGHEETRGLHWRVLLVNLLLWPLPPAVGPRVRSFVFRMLGFRIGRGTLLAGTPIMTGPPQLHRHLEIGRECYLNVGCWLDLAAPVTLADRVSLGHEVMLLTTSHRVGPRGRRAGAVYSAPVTIGAGAWLGARAVVLPGVTVGPGAIVAAGAIVVRDVSPDTLVGGIPARPLRELSPEEA